MKPIYLLKLTIVILMIVFPLVIAGCASSPDTQTDQTGQTQMMQTAPSGYNLDDLNNYGEWINVPTYGDAWHPYVVEGWMPYDNGYWTYSDAGWTWISYEPFGWIVYHYGYWYNDPNYGWVWIPSDNQWSPARVDWIDYGNYIGWAPMPPPGVVYASPWEARGKKYWNVVRRQDFDRENIADVRVENPVRNTMSGRGVTTEPPDRTAIQNATGRDIDKIRLSRETVRVQKREVERIKLPPPQQQRVEQNSPRVREKILLPPERRNERKNERKERGE